MQELLRTDNAGAGQAAEEGPTRDRPLIRRSEIDPGVEYVPPRGAHEAQLAEMWQQTLGVDRVGRDDSFFELGGDSLQAVELFLALERSFGVRLPAATLIAHPTIAQLAKIIDEGGIQAHCLELLREGTAPPLFLVHDGSGLLLCYRRLVERLRSARKIYGLQYPPDQENASDVLPIVRLAEIYTDAMLQVQPQGPYFVAGYSYGGFIAHEIAALLRKRGHEVALLVNIDAPVPGSVINQPQRRLRRLARHLLAMSEIPVSRWFDHVLQAIGRDIARARKTTASNGTQQGLPAGMPDPAQRRDAAFRTTIQDYRPSKYDGALKLVVSSERHPVRSHTTSLTTRCLGWSDFTSGPIETFDIPGEHWDAMLEPAVALVGAYLDIWLDEKH